MVEFLYFFIPGAIAYLISEKCVKQEEKNSIHSLLEWILCTGVIFGVVFLQQKSQGNSLVLIGEDGILSWDFSTIPYRVYLLIAVVFGFLYAVIKEINVQVQILPRSYKILGKVEGIKKKVLQVIILGGILLGGISYFFGPTISSYVQKQQLKQFQVDVKEKLVELQNAVDEELQSGVKVEEVQSVTVGKITMKRVDRDQAWNAKSPSGIEEGVFMLDGEGKVVYFSYRDKNYCATYSGPTEDSEFMDSHNTWNGGRGYGWSGIGMRKVE